MIDKEMIWNILIIAMIITIACSYFFITQHHINEELARTGTFILLIILEFITIGIIRQDYGVKCFSNKWIFISIGGALALSLGLIYIPYLADIFNLIPLSIETRGEI